MNRWSVAALDVDDALNQTIWNESPARQMKIFPARLPVIGMVAAAQAFVEPPPLPWVPDLVGRNWREQGSLLVMGISYADFFLPLPGRRSRMQLREYREAKGPAEFQAKFLEKVVRGDTAYYEPIADLLERADVELERTVITDICRASFGSWDGTRITAGAGILQNYDTAFRPYVRQNQDWHNSRLDEGGFQVIVTLGTLARYEVERWLTGRGWRARGLDSSFTSPAGRVLNILHAPHPNARGGRRPIDVAHGLRELLGTGSNPQTVPMDSSRRVTTAVVDAAQLLIHLAEANLSRGARRWRGNDEKGRNTHHGAVPVGESPLDIRLEWCRSSNAPSRLIGCYRLDLERLLAAGYVREDSKPAHIRLRFAHLSGGIYIQTRDGAPALSAGSFR